MQLAPQTKPTASDNVYVGIERYHRIQQYAIDVSNDTRVQVTPSQFVQHLTDHYSDIARANWSKTLTAAPRQRRPRLNTEAQGAEHIKAPTSNNCYIGDERFERITQYAIDISNDIRIQVKPSKFVQHLVDHYSDMARQNWLQTLASSGVPRDKADTEASSY